MISKYKKKQSKVKIFDRGLFYQIYKILFIQFHIFVAIIKEIGATQEFVLSNKYVFIIIIRI